MTILHRLGKSGCLTEVVKLRILYADMINTLSGWLGVVINVLVSRQELQIQCEGLDEV